MRETGDAEAPWCGLERRGLVNGREQIHVQVRVHGWLIDGIPGQPRMIPARRRILRSLRRCMVPVTRWNGG